MFDPAIWTDSIVLVGIIMAVAFSGLFLSEELILNQVAFFLVTAVLLDTFVIRTVLVPILMGFAGKHAWWPRPNVPDGTKNYGYEEDAPVITCGNIQF